jgi:Uma2 family endonuclease
MDLNLYYNVRRPLWHKRPDWFVALGVPRLYEGADLRLSYVVWQEDASPFVVVELLSPGTEAEDLGQRPAQPGQPPSKWQVYEQILRVPYYFLFDRYENQFRGFSLNHGRYQPLAITDQKFWLPELDVGLGVWYGTYQGVTRPWLRWYESNGEWVPTPEELAEQERQRAEQERQRAEQERQRAEQERQRAEQAEGQMLQIVQNLAQAGMSWEDIAGMTGLSEDQLGKFIDSGSTRT